MQFADRLKELRKSHHLTQDDMAEALCMKRQTYSAYERQISVPDINIIIKLADIFSVSVDYLLGKSDIKQKAEDVSPSNSIIVDENQKALINTLKNLSPENQKELHNYADLLALKQKVDKNKDAEPSASLTEKG